MNWLLVVAVAPLALVAVVVCIREPMRVALPLYAATIPFGDALSIGSSRFGSASSLLGLVLGLGLALGFVTGRSAAVRLNPSVPLWLLFLGLAGATALWTISPGRTISGLAVLTSLVLVFVLASLSEVDSTAVRRTENALILGGVAVVGYGLVQLYFFGGFGDAPAGSLEAGGSRFGDDLLGPNILAVTLLMPMAIGLQRAFDPEARTRRGLHLLAVAVLLVGVLLTGSRTGTVGAALVVLAMLVVSPPRARPNLAATGIVGVLVGVVVWTLHPWGVAERSFESATSSSGRLDIWQVGYAACQKYCGWGSGWGSFPEVYTRTLADVPGARVLSGSDGGAYEPHNVWLLAVVELGVVGALLLTAALAASFVQAVRLPPPRRAPAVGMMSALVAGLVFLSSIEFKIFWLVLLLVAMYQNVRPPEPGRDRGRFGARQTSGRP